MRLPEPTMSELTHLISEALMMADRDGLLKVGIHLNQALIALGHPGLVPPGHSGETLIVTETTQ